MGLSPTERSHPRGRSHFHAEKPPAAAEHISKLLSVCRQLREQHWVMWKLKAMGDVQAEGSPGILYPFRFKGITYPVDSFLIQ